MGLGIVINTTESLIAADLATGIWSGPGWTIVLLLVTGPLGWVVFRSRRRKKALPGGCRTTRKAPAGLSKPGSAMERIEPAEWVCYSRANARRFHGMARIAECIQKGEYLDTVLRDVAAILPFCWQHSEVTSARIELRGKTYESDGFEPGSWSLSGPILVNGHASGSVTVFYREERPAKDEGPFLREERNLLSSIICMLALAAERAQAKELLRDAEHKFLALFNNAVNGVLLIERFTKRCCLANEVFCGMMGYKAEEVSGLRLADIQPDLKGSNTLDQTSDPLIGQHSLRQDVLLKRKDGTTFYADVSSFPILVADKEYLLDIFKDVTERRWSQTQQACLMDQLSRANREMNDFVSVINRDLKALLRGINGLAGALPQPTPDLQRTEDQALIEVLFARVRRVEGLIDAVTKYSRIGQTQEADVPVDVNDFLVELTQALDLPASVQIRIQAGLPVLRTKPSTLVDIWWNLLSNAVTCMDKLEGSIEIGCVEDATEWRFHCRDNGPGIEKRYLDRVFQLFEILTPGGPGDQLGVGLPIVKKCVDTLNGRIWVESEVGQGSAFFFTVPKSRTAGHMSIGSK